MRGAVVLAALTSAVLLAQEKPSRDRAMWVSVVNQQGVPVTGLTVADFTIREDGAAREVLRAEPATTPIEMTLLLDTSDLASPFIADFRRSLEELPAQLGKGHQVGLTSFGGPPRALQGYAPTVPGALKQGIGRMFAEQGSGAYLLEALLSVAGGIGKRRPERAEALAILVKSSPEFSELPHQKVVAALVESGARFDAITVQTRGEPTFGGDQARAAHERDMALDLGTRATGGRNEMALTGLAVPPLVQSIAVELRQQYRVTYARPGALIPPQKIEVSVSKPGLTARGTPVKVN